MPSRAASQSLLPTPAQANLSRPIMISNLNIARKLKPSITMTWDFVQTQPTTSFQLFRLFHIHSQSTILGNFRNRAAHWNLLPRNQHIGILLLLLLLPPEENKRKDFKRGLVRFNPRRPETKYHSRKRIVVSYTVEN